MLYQKRSIFRQASCLITRGSRLGFHGGSKSSRQPPTPFANLPEKHWMQQGHGAQQSVGCGYHGWHEARCG